MSSSCSIKKSDTHGILVASFTNGQIKPEKSNALKFRYFTEKEKGGQNDEKKTRKVLVAERDTSTCKTYVGDSTDITAPSQLYKYYVGVRNKRTGKMKVYDADLFNMIPQLNVTEKQEVKPQITSLSYTDKMKELTKAFGSTKRQRAVELSQRNAIQTDVLDSAIGSAVDHAISQDNFKEITAKPSTDDSNDCLPPHHAEVTSPEDIYKVEDIIGVREMEALTEICRKFFDYKTDEFKNSEGYSTFIMNRLPILPLDEDRRWLKCKCLMYIHMLTTLYRKRANELREKDILPKEWPDKVKYSILQQFTLKIEGDGTRKPVRCLSIRMKDKIILHILVLCLIVDNFTLEYSDIAKDLKIGATRMPLLLRSVGCQIKVRVINKTSVKTAHLIAPLQLPEKNLIMGKRRK
ncbi:DNA-directed RNA polymerase I subunit RPA49 [Patella vulgata]|uniref:DNA-directed RNA polymerase I subunit RPA49 n=1 Tax=Patella vulgata TaxID=6465 RepID=UPI00217FB9EC|nr:DNA-directed RNA polymerase I subunit RPA49 [Patella vulgata]